jgi:hypothetical protein
VNCPRCDSRLNVTHTYSAGEAGKTSTAKCQSCGLTATIVSTIAKINPPRGKGAAAIAKEMKKDARSKEG